MTRTTITTNTPRTPLETTARTPLETTTPMEISDTAINNNGDNMSSLTIDYESDTKLEIISMEKLETEKEMTMVENLL
jgi:hypothetical protein